MSQDDQFKMKSEDRQWQIVCNPSKWYETIIKEMGKKLKNVIILKSKCDDNHLLKELQDKNQVI